MKFFKDIFVVKNLYSLFFLAISVILSNFSYVLVMSYFSDNQQLLSVISGKIEAYNSTTFLGLIILSYGVSYVISFYFQVYLANKFSVDLNIDMDRLMGVSVYKGHMAISQALVIKDISSEFARFGNNIILPITEIFKNLISLVIIIIAILLTQPALLIACATLLVTYSGFWLATKNFFVLISKRISLLLLQRQRLAEFKYQNYNELNLRKKNSLIQMKFEDTLHEIAKLNVVTKSIAIMPRAVIETAMLATIVYFVSWFGEGSIILIGLAGVKLLVSAQGVSNGVSNLQLNWPAFVEYTNRRSVYDKFDSWEASSNKRTFPRLIPAGRYKVITPELEFLVVSDIKLDDINICMLRGPSGIGKSTFLNTLCGFHQVENANSMNMKQGNQNVSFLGQNTQILTGTIKENITLCNNGVWNNGIALNLYSQLFGFEAARLADQKDEFEKFINKEVGMNSGISGGEAKRIRLMSSLLSDAKLFIWDEPFDGINPERVNQIVEYLKKLDNKLFLIIDHNTVSPLEVSSIINFHNNDNPSGPIHCELVSANV